MYRQGPLEIPSDYGKIRFSREEMKHILMSVAALTIAFTLVFSGITYGKSNLPGLNTAENLLFYIAVSFAAVFSGFLLHEFAHKFVAQRNGAWAEFRSYPFGLLIALVLSITGFLFAAPGAVYIQGMISKKQNGLISIAGPLTNLILGAAFISTGLLVSDIYLNYALRLIGSVNLLLAVFNLLPIPPLDGSKVLKWDLRVYIAIMAVAVILAAGVYCGWY